MADERAIRAAELAKLEAVVAEHGTEGEQVRLLLSGVKRSGTTLVGLAEAAGNGQRVGRFPPDPELLATLTRRAERRARLKLPRRECAGDPPIRYCDCLERALDQPGDDGKRAVLKLAAAFHRKPEPIPAPTPPPPEPQEANLDPSEPVSAPPPAEPEKPKPEPPGRVVHRTRKWFDEKPSFRDMTF